MRKLLVITLCCLAVAAIVCHRKPKPKAAAKPKPDSLAFAERAKELEFDFPAEALAPMSESEVAAYATALPGVVAALKKAGFKAPYLEGTPRQAFASIGLLADTMHSTPGFDAALARTGLKFTDFRSRFIQVWAAGYALSLDSSLDAFRAQGRDTLPEGNTVLTAFAPRIQACAKIPPRNKELVRQYRARLDLLREVL
jgi:hypothetical protein